MKKWFIFIIVVISVVISAATYTRLSGNKVKTVKTVQVKRGEIVDFLKATGRVEAVEYLVVRAREGIRIEKILVKEGDIVKSGQELLQIDLTERDDAVKKAGLKLEQAEIAVKDAETKFRASKRTYSDPLELETNFRSKEAAYKQAMIQKQAADRELKVAEELYNAGAESLLNLKAKEDRFMETDVQLTNVKQELDEARQRFSKKEKTNINLVTLRTEYENALRQRDITKSELDLTVSQLERLKVASTLDGTVVSIPAEDGMFVSAGQEMLTIADLDKLRVRAAMDELDAGKIKKGQKAEITFEAFPDKTFHGHVDMVFPQAVIKNDRTIVETVVLLEESTGFLKISNQVDVKIIVARRNDVLYLPLNAIHQSNDPFVWVYKNGTARKVKIKTGLSDIDSVEITEGLKQGDEVIIVRGAELKDGEKVESGV